MTTLPDIDRRLIQFAARRLAGLGSQEWTQLDKSVRDGYKEDARRVLKAERDFFDGQAVAAE